MSDHVHDDAELYPLGLLEPEAERALETHAATCVACAERVADAERTAAALAAALPSAEPSPALGRRIAASALAGSPAPLGATRRWNRRTLALAAGFVIALLALGRQAILDRNRTAADDLVLATIVHSHFLHVAMAPRSPHPVAAKVLYARDGAWVYVVADHPDGIVRAIVRGPAGVVDLGDLHGDGETAVLFVRPQARIDTVTLQRAGSDVASAKLVYSSR